jgi:hypothetical protein
VVPALPQELRGTLVPKQAMSPGVGTEIHEKNSKSFGISGV